MTWGKFQIQLIIGDLPRYCQDSGEKAVCLCNLKGALSKALCSLCVWLWWRGELSDKLSHSNAVRWGLPSTKQQITATVWMFSRPVCSAERCLFPVSFKNRASSFLGYSWGNPSELFFQLQLIRGAVLCRFCYYSGVLRPQSGDGCHWKCSLLLTDPKRRGQTTPWWGPWCWRGHRAHQEAEGVRVKHRQEPLLWFLQKGMGEAG